MAEIRDPIHGFIEFDDVERALIDSRPVQRLKYIHQLALGYLVYPGARHSRFEHALGTMELAGRAFDALIQNSPALSREVFGRESEHGRWRATVRVAGLLHDVGHAPFSHASDALFTGRIASHEQMTAEIIQSTEIAGIVQSVGTYRLDPAELAYIASGLGTPRSEAAIVAKELITGDLGVDRMDYLQRDSHMCGVRYGVFDLARLVGTLMLVRAESGSPSLAIEYGGMHAAEGLLTARYFMFSQVYFHDVRDAYDGHLFRYLERNLADSRYPDEVEEYLEWDDIRVLSEMRGRRTDADAAAILERKHFRRVWEFSPNALGKDPSLPDRARELLQRKFGSQVMVRDSRRSTVTLGPGQVYVIDWDTGQREDILDRSTTLGKMSAMWLARVYTSAETRTDVLAALKSAGLVPGIAEEDSDV